MRRLLLAAVMFGAASGTQAADMPDFLRGSISPPVPVLNRNWNGYYVGGQADWGSIDSWVPAGINGDMQSTFLPPGVAYNWQPLGRAHSLHGGIGAFAGYNSQWEDVVIGLEANYLHGGFRATSSSTGYTYNPDLSVASTTHSNAAVKVTDFGSLRVRAGYAWGCALPYGFLGAGLGSQTVERSVSAVPGPLLPAWTTDTKTKLVYGYSAGFGVDFMLAGGVFTRLEYEYQRVTADIESNINTVRLGIGYKF